MNVIKSVIRNPYKVLSWAITNTSIGRVLPDKAYLSIKYKSAFGRRINWEKPVTFNEKLQWLKLYDRKEIYATMVDKYDVKKYVSDIIGQEHIIPTLGVWDKFEDIDFSLLPNQFVLKCTHDSGGLVICKDKTVFDIKGARRKINQCLNRDFYWIGREWPYKSIKPRIIAEQYMEDDSDRRSYLYRLFEFDGIAKALYITSGSHKEERKTISEFHSKVEFELLPFSHLIPDSNELHVITLACKKMIEYGKKLSWDIPQLRADYYRVNRNAYFAELEYNRESELDLCKIPIWEEKHGEWLTLPESYGGGYVLIDDGYVLWLHPSFDSQLTDFKVFCFNGVPKIILVCSNRFNDGGLKEDFYDTSWNHLNMSRPRHDTSNVNYPKPEKLNEMIDLTKRISGDMMFSRVDFYIVNNHVYFGEITLYPASGFESFLPDSWDYDLGKWLKLV